MPVYSVSSAFIDAVVSDTVDVSRTFTIGNSDYSEFVTSWPKINRKWNDLKPKKATVKLANQNQTFNFFRDEPTTLTSSCSIKVGVNFTPSSKEEITIFSGTIGKVTWGGNGATTDIALIDKLKPFGERVVGSSDAPEDFTNSDYYPSDIAWYLVTSFGGLSSVESTSNPDIDYASWESWHQGFIDNTVLVRALFDGQKVMDGLRKVGRMTGSSIIEENTLISFTRYAGSSVDAFEVSSNANLGVSLAMDDEKIINKQIVNANYDVTSRYFTITVNDEDATSVNSYGLREQLEKDEVVWYVNSVAALDYAQRSVEVNKDPKQEFGLTTGLQLLGRAVGETIQVTHSPLSLNEDIFRIMGYNFDLNTCRFKASIDTSQLRTFFTLDDGYLGLLDQAYNPLG